MKTVDVVVTGDETAAVGAAVDAVRRGQRVLVVLRSAGARVVSRLRRLSPSRRATGRGRREGHPRPGLSYFERLK
jgi:hypothetical protein